MTFAHLNLRGERVIEQDLVSSYLSMQHALKITQLEFHAPNERRAISTRIPRDDVPLMYMFPLLHLCSM